MTRVAVDGLVWTRNGRRVLDVPTLRLEGPGLVLLVGPSGAGKSSLLKALTGRLSEIEGGHVDGTVRHEPATTIGYVPQDARDTFLAHDPLTEFQVRLQALGWRHDAARDEARRRLQQLGLADQARIPLHRLSGGERRRLALHTVRTHRPGMLLLDEPLTHLDDDWRGRLLADLLEAAFSSLVIVSTHDVMPWIDSADRVLHIRDGRLLEAAPTGPAPPVPPPARRAEPARLTLSGVAAPTDRPLFRDVELALGDGLHAIVGPNGSGKTTLLHVIAGLEHPAEGRVRFDGRDLIAQRPSARASKVALHIQDPGQLFYMARAEDEVGFQPTNAGVAPADVTSRVKEAADAFDVGTLLGRHPTALSGGQQERLALACADAARPQLFLLDEPTNGLDADGWTRLYAFLGRVRLDSCVIVATHDRRLIRACDTVHRIAQGRLRPTKLEEPVRASSP